jgi:nucleotide-binding universal stress UspA family protein
MKTILFPTDFSKNAVHASEYAGLLAEKFDAKVILLHVFSIPMVPATHTSYNVRFAIEGYRKTLSKELEKFVEKFIKVTSISPEKVSSKIEYGFPADKILEIAKEIHADMIVMGTKGASNFVDKWLGTNTEKVIKEAECPVWVIPYKAKVEYPESVLYAADFQEDEIIALHKLLHIIEPLKAHCNVVHINDFFELYQGAPLKDMVHYLNDEFENDDITFQSINSEGVIAGLESYITLHKPNLLALAVHEKSFWSKIFDKSITTHFVQDAKLPLLIFKK